MQFHNLQTVDELQSLAIINKNNLVVIEDSRLTIIIFSYQRPLQAWQLLFYFC
jgi:hypothetical protein